MSTPKVTVGSFGRFNKGQAVSVYLGGPRPLNGIIDHVKTESILVLKADEYEQPREARIMISTISAIVSVTKVQGTKKQLLLEGCEGSDA